MSNDQPETRIDLSQRRAARWTLAGAVVALAGAAVLFRWNPAEVEFYPPCVFHYLTGLHCPGCGTLRGLHQLLHGNLLGAFDCNPFMVLSIPLIGYAVVAGVLPGLAGRPPRGVVRPVWIWGLLASIVLFAILRNIPVYPLTLLAPPG